MHVEKWGLFEVYFNGKTQGNPFTDYGIKGKFVGDNEEVTVDGFYDGDGVYKVRFMPSFEGKYTYTVSPRLSCQRCPVLFLLPGSKGCSRSCK